MSEGSPPQETIGERLRRLRTQRKLSQRDLSSPGVSYAYISRIEAGTRQPSVKALRKLAQKLGVSPDYLETGREISDADRRELRLANAELALRLAEDLAAAEEELRAILDDAIAAGDVRAATRAGSGLGMAAAHQGRYDDAIRLLEDVLERADPSPAERPDIFHTLGRSYAATGRADRAVELFERALERVERETPGDIPAQIRVATFLSHALVDVGELARAHEVVSRALEHAGPNADAQTRIRLYWSLARVARLDGNLNRALDYARRAIALLETTEDTLQLARAHLLAASLLIRRGDAERAGLNLDLAEQLLTPDADAIDRAYLRTEQAKRALALGQLDAAIERARESLSILGDSDPGEQGAVWAVLAAALARTGEVAAAVEAYRRAADSLETAGRWQDAAQTCREWGRTLRDAGRDSEALDVLDRAATLAARAPAPPVRSGA